MKKDTQKKLVGLKSIKNFSKENVKNIRLQGVLNPGLLACLADVLPLDQGVKWISHKKIY